MNHFSRLFLMTQSLRKLTAWGFGAVVKACAEAARKKIEEILMAIIGVSDSVICEEFLDRCQLENNCFMDII